MSSDTDPPNKLVSYSRNRHTDKSFSESCCRPCTTLHTDRDRRGGDSMQALHTPRADSADPTATDGGDQ